MTADRITRLKTIRLLLLDVDGVMTDGSITYDGTGDEIKTFNSRDGFGLKLLMNAGIGAGIVTGRSSPALLHRCKNLKIDLLFDGVTEKAPVLEKIMERTGLPPAQMAFMGDDLIDLPLMRRTGFSIAVADAHEIVREHADMVTVCNGGRGAVREVCEAILKAQGLWEDIIRKYNG